MQSGKVVFSIVVLALSLLCASNETAAQNSKINLSKETALSNFFKDGETIITEVEFLGLDSDCETYDGQIGKTICEGDLFKVLRENHAAISIGEKFSSLKVEKVFKFLKEWLAGKGYLKAEVVALGENLPQNQMRLLFSVKRSVVVRVSEIRFTGNKNIESEELIGNFKNCLDDRLDVFNKSLYEYCARKHSLGLMFSKGYFEARIEQVSPRLVSDSYVVTVKVKEGIRYRIGEIAVSGAKVFSEKDILEMSELKTGDVADGQSLQYFVYEKLKKFYGDKGYVNYNAEFEPKFIPPQAQGLDGNVNISIDIDEGIQFKLANIKFVGAEKEKARELRKAISLKDGEVFNQSEFRENIMKIDGAKEFYPIDADKDVELVMDEKNGLLYAVIKLTKIK